MAEQAPRFQLSVDFFNVEIATTLKSLRDRWLVRLMRIDLHLLEIVLIFCLQYCYRDVIIYFIKGIKKKNFFLLHC